MHQLQNSLTTPQRINKQEGRERSKRTRQEGSGVTKMASKVLLALLLLPAAGAQGGVYTDTYNLLLSETLPGNLLPQFKFQLGATEGGSLEVKIGGGDTGPEPYVPYDTAPDDIWDHASTDLRAPSLPYLLQDQWTCERTPTDVPTVAYENERLKLSITPQWGARIWSVYDKELERDWTFANPAHQPANIGVLKSWSAGGIEFNWSPGMIGHSVFSESPAYLGLLETDQGPVLRAYEYDRRNQSVWQVDVFLPAADAAHRAKHEAPRRPAPQEKKKQKKGAGKHEHEKDAAASKGEASSTGKTSTSTNPDEDVAKLWLHPKVTNTQSSTDLQGYWWTCVAVPAAPSTRVVTPATWNLETSSDHSVGSPWPIFSMGNDNASFVGTKGSGSTDNSWLSAIWSGDFFMGPLERGGSVVNYISYAEEAGFVGFHGHPLNGTKFFTWGQSGPGRFMQDFLGGISGPKPAANRTGDYMELQVGPAYTQFQTFDLPAATTLEWTEVFGAFEGDATQLHSSQYSDALSEVEGWLDSPEGVNDTAFLNTDAWLATLADTPLDSILASGSPWGAVEEIRRAAATTSSSASSSSSSPPHSKHAKHGHAHDDGLRRGARQATGSSSSSDSARLAPGLTFDHDAAWNSPESRPWCELATDGAFSADTLASQPLSYQIGDEWLNLLLAAEDAAQSSNWLTNLHVAVALIERGDVDEPKTRLAKSLEAQRLNPVAARTLAVLMDSVEAAWPLYQKAFTMALELASGTADDDNTNGTVSVASVNVAAGQQLLLNLGSEMCAFLQGAELWADLQTFVEGQQFADAIAQAPSLATLDTVLLSQVYVALRAESPAKPEDALAVLGASGPAGCFPTFGRARSVLMDLWFEANQMIEETTLGRPLLPIEARDNRVSIPVPRNIGCPYASWSGANKCQYW